MRVILTRNTIRMGGGGGECKPAHCQRALNADMFNDILFYVFFTPYYTSVG